MPRKMLQRAEQALFMVRLNKLERMLGHHGRIAGKAPFEVANDRIVGIDIEIDYWSEIEVDTDLTERLRHEGGFMMRHGQVVHGSEVLM